MILPVREWGAQDAPPLLCLHGLSGHAGRFAGLAERLGGRRVIALDLRGHGSAGWGPPWDVATHVADVLETAADLGVGVADWAGVSFGGRIAATLAAGAPDRVRRLVLLDPALHVDVATAAEQATLELDSEGYDTPEGAIEDRLAGGTLFSTPRQFIEQDAAEHLVRGDDGRLRWRYSSPMAITAWSEMARPAPPVAPVPTLIVTGDKSWIPVDAAAHREVLGDALQLTELDSGHSLLWDALDATAAVVGEFLRDE